MVSPDDREEDYLIATCTECGEDFPVDVRETERQTVCRGCHLVAREDARRAQARKEPA